MCHAEHDGNLKDMEVSRYVLGTIAAMAYQACKTPSAVLGRDVRSPQQDKADLGSVLSEDCKTCCT